MEKEATYIERHKNLEKMLENLYEIHFCGIIIWEGQDKKRIQ